MRDELKSQEIRLHTAESANVVASNTGLIKNNLRDESIYWRELGFIE